jgi:hypothetical protein
MKYWFEEKFHRQALRYYNAQKFTNQIPKFQLPFLQVTFKKNCSVNKDSIQVTVLCILNPPGLYVDTHVSEEPATPIFRADGITYNKIIIWATPGTNTWRFITWASVYWYSLNIFCYLLAKEPCVTFSSTNSRSEDVRRNEKITYVSAYYLIKLYDFLVQNIRNLQDCPYVKMFQARNNK